MKNKTPAIGPGAIDLLEEAVHLLRGAPAGLYAVYAVGVLPCALAFLYFWADMSRGAFAREHAGLAAAAMGLMFVWMKCWQAVFADGLRARLAGGAGERWTVRRAGWLALRQSAVQPSALFVVPLALVIMLPLAWVFSFYQNFTALGGEPGGLGDSCRAAARQASHRPGQCYLVLGLLSLFTFLVWLNLLSAMAWLPDMLKTLFGVETAFTQAGWKSILNTTYLACSCALTYVCVDPLIKSVFALRCFYGQSIQTGHDLKSELARLRAPASPSLAVLAVMAFFSLAGTVLAVPPEPPPTPAVSPAELNHSIDEVLQRREFAWRMPREKPKDNEAAPKSWFDRALGAVLDIMEDAVKYCLHSLGTMLKWIGKMIGKLWPASGSAESEAGGLASGWQSALQMLLLILIVGIAAILAVLLIRLWQRRYKKQVVTAEAIAATPDLNAENVTADQLPEDEWLRMARELMAQGNFRLALRALYLAGLAHLAAREFIAIAKFKSNRDYEMEVLRRARAQPEVQKAFSQNVAIFDRVWYGLHEVNQAGVEEFQSNLARIRTC
jgi:hypothetical protein